MGFQMGGGIWGCLCARRVFGVLIRPRGVSCPTASGQNDPQCPNICVGKGEVGVLIKPTKVWHGLITTYLMV